MDEKRPNKDDASKTPQEMPKQSTPNPSPDTSSDPSPESSSDYPSGMKLALLMLSVYVVLFLVSLDRLIISTAIPQITDDFHSAGDIGWYGTAYMLTNCAFQLIFGKIYQNFSVKTVFLTAILLFEVGSALCGATPNSIAFILGRALAGLGAGGIQAGILVIIVYAVPLHNRPKYQGHFGAVFGISSIVGPLIGGALTTNATWRWCFYLNLPLGGAVLVIVVFLLHLPVTPGAQRPLHEKLRQMNVPGVLALLSAIVCLALPDQATVPPRIFLQRSIFAGFLVSCCTGAHMTLLVYYLPLWFQAVQGVSPVRSGVHLLPMVLPLILSTIATGLLVSRIGYFTPFLLVGTCLAAVGTGLLTTLRVDTPPAHWIGFQVLYGLGLGSCTQAPNMAAQTVLPRADVAIGASLIGPDALDNQLAARLQAAGIPGITPAQIQTTGATDLLQRIPNAFYAAAPVAYNWQSVKKDLKKAADVSEPDVSESEPREERQ